MAVVGSAREVPAGTGGRVTAGGNRTRERHFIVEVDSPSDGTVTIQMAPGLPQIGNRYDTGIEFDNGMVAVDYVIDRDARTRLLWHVTVVYSTDYDSIANILNQPPDFDFPSEFSEEPIIGQEKATLGYPPPDSGTSDDDPHKFTAVNNKTGKGIINSAGNVYDPPATRRVVTPLMRLTRNEQSFSLAKKVQYENTVNKFPWNGLGSRVAFCRLISPRAMFFQPPTPNLVRVLYWSVTYEFAFKYETWDLILPDAGPFYLEYTGGTAYRKPFMTPAGQPMIGLLDHSTTGQPGKKLAAGAECQYNRWRRYREEDFSALNINIDLTLQAIRTRNRGFVPTVDPSKTPVAVA